MDSNKQNLVNKIFYRARYRGSKEMDAFILSFVISIIKELSIDELEDLNEIVNLNDEEILNIINKNSKKRKLNADILFRLKKFKNNL
tara:strand:- start:43 stop:303 length:261 start_codon:yes stop_codon:yes gene_type:complete